MRILHIIGSMDPKNGGPVEGIFRRARYLLQMGYSVEVLTLDAPDAPFLRDILPLKVHAVGPGRGRFGYGPGLRRWLVENVSAYDHVFVHGLWQYHGIGTARVLWSLNKPYYVFAHGMLDPWFKERYPLKHLKKWIYWLIAEYWVLRRAKFVLFTTEEERIRSRDSFCLYHVNERVVSYGTSEPPHVSPEIVEQVRHEVKGGRGGRIVLFLGRIHPKKGCDLLIRAFAAARRLSEIQLVMAGPVEQAYKDQLTELALGLGVADDIVWLGLVTGDRKWALLRVADVFMLPSHQENFGVAVAEALGSGLPVVISDKVNIWREVLDDGAGLVGDDTEEGARESLSRWLMLEPAQTRKMAECARSSFEKRYSIVAMANGLLSVISE